MPCFLPFTARVCLVLLIVCSTCSGRQGLYLNLISPIEGNDSVLMAKRTENFRRLLDYIRDSPEFCPLTLCVVFSDVDSGLDQLVLRYIGANSINAYTMKSKDSSLMGTWRNKINLTWIFFVNNFHDLNAIIYWQQQLWKATDQYLVVFTNEHTMIPWRDTFEVLWKRYNVYRVVVASVHDDYRCLRMYLPFTLSGHKFGAVHKLCLNGTDDQRSLPDTEKDTDRTSLLRKGQEIFEKFADLKGYPMNVIVFASLMMDISYDANKMTKFSRVDADVMAVLEEAMQVKFRVRVIQGPLQDDPFHRALRYIEHGNAELIITGYFIKHYDDNHRSEFTAAVYNDKLCFIAPTAGLIPKSYMPFMPFEKELWIILIAYNILITILWHLIRYISVSFRDQRQIVLPLAARPSLDAAPRIKGIASRGRMMRSLNRSSVRRSLSRFPNESVTGQRRTNAPVRSGAPLKGLPLSVGIDPPEIHPHIIACFKLLETSCYPVQGGQTSAQRAFLFGTLFFGLIVTGVYQSCLVSSLSKPFHYPELNTLEDVIDSNKTIVTKYWNLKNTFIDNSEQGRRIFEKIQVVSSDQPTNRMVAYTGKVIALGRYDSLKLENLTAYYDKEGNNLLHIVEECPATYMVSYVVRLYSPYRERINAVLLSMTEAGLVELWHKNVMYPLEVEARKREDAASERKIKLTLEHYTLTFLGLIIGLLCCTLVFLGEIYFAQRSNSPAQTRNV